MRFRTPQLTAALLLCAGVAGCGKSLPAEAPERGAVVTKVAGAGTLSASGVVTKNTTRLGGANPVTDAAAVALATYPGLTAATRPQAVAVVDAGDWPAALASAALASAPLRAPLLYAEGAALPALSERTLAALHPTGAPVLGGAQVIEVGSTAPLAGYRAQTLGGAGAGGAGAGGASGGGGASGARATRAARSADEAQAAVAARVERLVARLHGGPPHRVIVVGADGPPALAMPAAGLAAESGAPILPVYAWGVPRATAGVLARLRHPVVYVIGPPAAVGHAVLARLARMGSVHRIYPSPAIGGASATGASEPGSSVPGASEAGSPVPGTAGTGPAESSIAVARYLDGPFGWGVNQPGHGLVFASATRPLDAPAAAPLAASGDYAPLLVLDGPAQVPAVLARYLGYIQPAYALPQYPPVRGAYNRGWVIGDDDAIAPTVQAQLDAMLEISPQESSTPPASGAGTQSAEPTTAPPAASEPPAGAESSAATEASPPAP